MRISSVYRARAFVGLKIVGVMAIAVVAMAVLVRAGQGILAAPLLTPVANDDEIEANSWIARINPAALLANDENTAGMKIELIGTSNGRLEFGYDGVIEYEPWDLSDPIEFQYKLSTNGWGESGVYYYDGHYYKLVEDTVTWADAVVAAETMTIEVDGKTLTSGHLLEIDSSDEEAALSKYVRKNSVWTNGNDIGMEGDWYWGDASLGKQFWQGDSYGSAVGGAYANWHRYEPNNGESQEHCMEANLDADYGDLGWNDVPCDEMMGYIVEFESEPAGAPVVESEVATVEVVYASSGLTCSQNGLVATWDGAVGDVQCVSSGIWNHNADEITLSGSATGYAMFTNLNVNLKTLNLDRLADTSSKSDCDVSGEFCHYIELNRLSALDINVIGDNKIWVMSGGVGELNIGGDGSLATVFLRNYEAAGVTNIKTNVGVFPILGTAEQVGEIAYMAGATNILKGGLYVSATGNFADPPGVVSFGSLFVANDARLVVNVGNIGPKDLHVISFGTLTLGDRVYVIDEMNNEMSDLGDHDFFIVAPIREKTFMIGSDFRVATLVDEASGVKVTTGNKGFLPHYHTLVVTPAEKTEYDYLGEYQNRFLKAYKIDLFELRSDGDGNVLSDLADFSPLTIEMPLGAFAEHKELKVGYLDGVNKKVDFDFTANQRVVGDTVVVTVEHFSDYALFNMSSALSPGSGLLNTSAVAGDSTVALSMLVVQVTAVSLVILFGAYTTLRKKHRK